MSDALELREFGRVVDLVGLEQFERAFVIGLELDPSRLWRLRTAVLGLGGTQVAISAVALAAIAAYWLQYCVQASSTSVSAQRRSQTGLSKSHRGGR